MWEMLIFQLWGLGVSLNATGTRGTLRPRPDVDSSSHLRPAYL
jgi:hypothetical protein